jgi:hypothetical protein
MKQTDIDRVKLQLVAMGVSWDDFRAFLAATGDQKTAKEMAEVGEILAKLVQVEQVEQVEQGKEVGQGHWCGNRRGSRRKASQRKMRGQSHLRKIQCRSSSSSAVRQRGSVVVYTL